MAQQQNTGHSSQWGSPKRRTYQVKNTDWATEVPMMRGDSTDSSNYSNTTDGTYSKNSPDTMYIGIRSPTYDDDSFSDMQYQRHQYLEPSRLLERSSTNQTHFSRATPSSLGWVDASLLKVYKFVIQKGKEPYFELLPGCVVTPDTPQRVYLDCPRSQKKKDSPCMYPACEDKSFKRPADLERHYRNVHASLDQKEQFLCDYPPCRRVRGPFTRKDHYRAHLREYHKEDFGCVKGEKKLEKKDWLKLQDAWVAERRIATDWIRCPKCLCRVHIKVSGYECKPCKYRCDRDRIARIEALRANSASRGSETTEMEGDRYGSTTVAATPEHPNCSTCKDSAYIWNSNNGGSWSLCPSCTPPLEETYYNFGYDLDNGNASYPNSSGY